MKSIREKYKSLEIAFVSAVFILVQSFSGYGISFDPPALIPMPQKITWGKFQFKIEGRESRIVSRIIANFPEAPFNADEAYSLTVDADSVILKAKTRKGLFRGMQTIKQLTFIEKDRKSVV